MQFFFQVFIQHATYHPYNANVYINFFIHIMQQFFQFFIVKYCIM
jgi:hypothetical protein